VVFWIFNTAKTTSGPKKKCIAGLKKKNVLVLLIERNSKKNTTERAG
jgi:hypothetical protein